MQTFQYQITVPPAAVDINGHVNNVAFVGWMQDAAVQHSDACGGTRELYESLGVTWVARSHYIRYFKPGFVDQEITVTTWIDSWRKVSCLRKYQFVRAEDDELLARAETEWVYIDSNSGRPRALHDDVKQKFSLAVEENH